MIWRRWNVNRFQLDQTHCCNQNIDGGNLNLIWNLQKPTSWKSHHVVFFYTFSIVNTKSSTMLILLSLFILPFDHFVILFFVLVSSILSISCASGKWFLLAVNFSMSYNLTLNIQVIILNLCSVYFEIVNLFFKHLVSFKVSKAHFSFLVVYDSLPKLSRIFKFS